MAAGVGATGLPWAARTDHLEDERGTPWNRLSPPAAYETVAPWPLPAELLEELYVQLGLSAFQIGLLCGFGALAVLNRLRALGMEVRPAGQPCPWTQRCYG